MLSTKNNGLFVEVGRFKVTVAATSTFQSPLVIEKIAEMAMDAGKDKIKEFILGFSSGKSVKYSPCNVAVYPTSRFFFRHSAETPAKLKEVGYFEEMIPSQFGVDIATNSVSIINASDGLPFEPTRSLAVQRELLIAGASVADLKATQEDLLAQGIYPLCMELGTLSMLGAIRDYMRFSGAKRPVLMLEVDTTSSSIYIISTDRIDLCKKIPIGLDSMIPVISGELGIKDEQSARNMLYSNTFDFTEMGPTLLGKLIKEIRASTGFYEVQTGQSIGNVFMHLLPSSLAWVRQSLSKALGIEPFKIDYKPWLEARGVKLADSVNGDTLSDRSLGVISLMLNHERPVEP